MAEPAYRYLLCDLLTDQLLADLPLSGVSFDRRISRVGSFQGQLQAATQRQVDLGRLLYDYAGRSALWVFRGDQVWWAGIPWTVKARQGARGGVDVAVQAATFDSYAHHRVLRLSWTFGQVDQAQIIHGLWDDLQGRLGPIDPRGDIGVVTDPGQLTGVLRDREYLGSDLPRYGELIEKLGDVEGGPEHTIDTYLDGNGKRVKRLRVANRLGVAEARVVFQRARAGGGRVLEWEAVADAVDGGTTFTTRGDAPNGNVGEDVHPLMSDVHYAGDLLAVGWPLLDVTEDHSGVKELGTLNDHAAGLLEQHAGAMKTQGYTVQVGDTGWNPNRLGDAVRLKLRDLWHTEPVDITARPVACKVTAAEAGHAEQVQLTFGDEAA